MAFQIIRNNIINVEADAIVNTANPKVAVGRGVDHDIYEAAGWDRLLEERAKIGDMLPGEAAYTPAFDLNAKYIIHVIGPAWQGGDCGERETVASCYSNALALAAELGCESIAFPLLATGTYGFPKDEALRIAIDQISSFLLRNEMEVMLVVYDKESFEVSGKLFSDIRTFIGDPEPPAQAYRRQAGGSELSYGGEPLRNMNTPVEEGSRRGFIGRLRRKTGSALPEEPAGMPFESQRSIVEERRTMMPGAPAVDEDYDLLLDSEALVYEEDLDESAGYIGSFETEEYEAAFPGAEESLDKRLFHLDKTFQQYLFMLIDRRGLSDPEVYKKANIDRKHFSKIRSNIDYMPSKKTALALAIALELSLDETKDLLGRAGLALSPSIKSDKIIEYCIETGNYDIYEINCILFNYDQPTLGA